MEQYKADDTSDRILIKDVARLMRVTSETIRFYERRKIITPHRDDDNRYRYYTQADIRKLYDCKIYQGLGFSIKEIIQLFQSASAEVLDEMLWEKEQELQKTIEQNTETLNKIRKVQKANHLFEHYYGNYYITDSPHCLASFHSDSEVYHKKSVKHVFWDHLAAFYNDFICTAQIPLSVARESGVSKRMKNGYSISFEKAQKLGIEPGGPVIELTPKRSVYTVFHAEPVVDSQHLVPILDWIEKSNLKACDDIICNTPKITFNHGSDSRIYEVWIPVE